MIPPMMTPLIAMMARVRIPRVAPPMKRRTQACRLFAKMKMARATGSRASTFPITWSLMTWMNCCPVEGLCLTRATPATAVRRKAARATTAAVRRGRSESDMKHHPHHVPHPGSEPDHDHREEDEVRELPVSLPPVQFEDVNGRDDHDELQGEEGKRGPGPPDQRRADHMDLLVRDGAEVDAISRRRGIEHLPDDEEPEEGIRGVLPSEDQLEEGHDREGGRGRNGEDGREDHEIDGRPGETEPGKEEGDRHRGPHADPAIEGTEPGNEPVLLEGPGEDESRGCDEENDEEDEGGDEQVLRGRPDHPRVLHHPEEPAQDNEGDGGKDERPVQGHPRAAEPAVYEVYGNDENDGIGGGIHDVIGLALDNASDVIFIDEIPNHDQSEPGAGYESTEE